MDHIRPPSSSMLRHVLKNVSTTRWRSVADIKLFFSLHTSSRIKRSHRPPSAALEMPYASTEASTSVAGRSIVMLCCVHSRIPRDNAGKTCATHRLRSICWRTQSNRLRARSAAEHKILMRRFGLRPNSHKARDRI